MKRREFIAGLGSAAAWPLAALAQQPALPVVGVLSSTSASEVERLRAFREGMSENGYVEGRNVAVEYHFVVGDYDRLPELAADLVGRKVAAIAAIGALPVVLAARAATTTIPIVFAIGGDPVRLGLVASLSHPGGNLTGATLLNTEVLPKRLELLHELVPMAVKIALLVNPTNPAAEPQSRDARAAARILGLQLDVVHASTEREIDAAFVALAQLGAGGLVIAGDGLFVNRTEQLAALALRHAVPAIFQFPEFAAAGGLMSYGPGETAQRYGWRQVGIYTGRILKGDKPADLPVQQATRIELVINLKTAKLLGLTFPLSLLGRADKVIE